MAHEVVYGCNLPTQLRTYGDRRSIWAIKGQVAVLLQKSESSADETKIITLACIVLRDMCTEYGDTISKKCDLSKLKDTSTEGSKNRIALAQKLYNEKMTGKVI